MPFKIDLKSYRNIFIAALCIRVIAAIFSPGYGMHDDHFLVIEASSSWVDDYDYNHWLPGSEGNKGPEGHSFTYVGLNYIYFSVFKGIGISDPKILMLINRLLHAFFSLLVVYFGIRITEKLSNKKNAVTVGWFLALLWIIPFLSVRNLVEVTCIPFIMWSIWLMIKNTDMEHIKNNFWNYLFAGLLMGMAVSFRYQVGVLALGLAAYYFFKWKFVPFAIFSLGVIITFSLTQGLVDYMIWGYPFAELLGYFTYNMNEGMGYIPNDDYFMYVLVLMGALLFPMGLLIGVGFFRSAKKYLVLFLPVILFIIFHSFYPSKQERFILPVLPLFIMMGVMGYELLLDRSFWKKAWNVSLKMFWVLNIPLLLLASFTYTKKSRVESMYYFYENNIEPNNLLLESTGETGASMVPRFYGGTWVKAIYSRTDKNQPLGVREDFNVFEYIFFYGEEELSERIAAYKNVYPNMQLEKICEPSFVDKFLRWLNPRNSNEYIEVWKTNVSSDPGL